MAHTFNRRLVLVAVMLFMALLAAVTFFVQARQRLTAQVADLNSENSALAMTLTYTEDTLSTTQSVAAAQSTQIANLSNIQIPTFEAEITSFQQEVATLTVHLGESQAEVGRLQTEVNDLHDIPPYVRLISPLNGATYAPNQNIPIIVSASDAYGLVALNITIDGNTYLSLTPENDVALVTQYEQWLPPADGVYTIGVMAVDLDGHDSELITSEITVLNIDQVNADLRTEIETNVISLRGLTPTQAIEPILMTPEEFNALLTTDLASPTAVTDTLETVLFLNAFDFVPLDFDYANFTIDLLSEQVAGYYDPTTGEFVVISADNILSVGEQLTHAHEYTHALQDQYYNLTAFNDESMFGDASLAFRAFVEGDATLVQQQYILEYLDPNQEQELLQEITNLEMDTLQSTIPPLAHLFAFPYEAGLAFAQALYNEGGFARVDEAWRELPTSTEQILHPTRYLADDAPKTVTLISLLDTLGADWEQVTEGVLGEFFLREYLALQVSAEDAAAAAEGWGGDHYAVYRNDRQNLSVMTLRHTWDTLSEVAEFATTYSIYATQRYGVTATVQNDLSCWSGIVNGVNDATCFYQNDQETFIVRAPNLPTARTSINLQYPSTSN